MRLLRILIPMCTLVAPVQAQDRPAGGPPLPKGFDLFVPVATELQLTASAAVLGRRLFFDARLSRDGSVSCASCHDAERAFTDGRRVSSGVANRRGTRNAATLVNRGYGQSHFWDGRARSLVDQVLQPIEHELEMALPRATALARIAADPTYVAHFHSALASEVSLTALAHALATYVATIFSGDAPFDRYAAGDTLALTAEQRLGRRLFDGKANCSACHRGANFTDEQFHNTGAAIKNGVLTDSGRFQVTRSAADIGGFKTPTLREVARTAPYMHDGSLETLAQVIDFYDRGGTPNQQLDLQIRPLALTSAEKRALIAFLHALSGAIREGGW